MTLLLRGPPAQLAPDRSGCALGSSPQSSVATEALERGALGYVVEAVPCARPPHPGHCRARRRPAEGAQRTRLGRVRIVADLDAFVATTTNASPARLLTSSALLLLNASYGVEAHPPPARDRRAAAARSSGRGSKRSAGSGPRPSWRRSGWSRTGSVTETAGCVVPERSVRPRSSTDNGCRSPRAGVAVESIGEGANSIVNLAGGRPSTPRTAPHPFVVYDGDLRDTARRAEAGGRRRDPANPPIADARRVPGAARSRARRLRRDPGARAVAAPDGGGHATVGVRPPRRADGPHRRARRAGVADGARDLAWLRRTRATGALRVSVDGSAVELRDPDYPVRVGRRPPRRRSARLRAPARGDRVARGRRVGRGRRRARRDRDLGVQLSVDDFGTGYSSFAALTRSRGRSSSSIARSQFNARTRRAGRCCARSSRSAPPSTST